MFKKYFQNFFDYFPFLSFQPKKHGHNLPLVKDGHDWVLSIPVCIWNKRPEKNSNTHTNMIKHTPCPHQCGIDVSQASWSDGVRLIGMAQLDLFSLTTEDLLRATERVVGGTGR